MQSTRRGSRILYQSPMGLRRVELGAPGEEPGARLLYHHLSQSLRMRAQTMPNETEQRT
jgi:hypothetical protein